MPKRTSISQFASRRSHSSGSTASRSELTAPRPSSDVDDRVAAGDVSKPQVGELFLRAVGLEPVVEVLPVDAVLELILIETTEDERFFAGRWVDVALQALRTHFFHHALHRRVDASDRD